MSFYSWRKEYPGIEFPGYTHMGLIGHVGFFPEMRFDGNGPKSQNGTIASCLTLYHSSHGHLYADSGWPCWYQGYEQPLVHVRYRIFRESGQKLFGVQLQHFGRDDRGDVSIALWLPNLEWRITIRPQRILYFVQFKEWDAVGLFTPIQGVMAVPKALLPVG